MHVTKSRPRGATGIYHRLCFRVVNNVPHPAPASQVIGNDTSCSPVRMKSKQATPIAFVIARSRVQCVERPHAYARSLQPVEVRPFVRIFSVLSIKYLVLSARYWTALRGFISGIVVHFRFLGSRVCPDSYSGTSVAICNRQEPLLNIKIGID